MGKLGVDLSNTETEFKAYPTGTYEVQCRRPKRAISKNGKPHWDCPMKIVNHSQLNGRKVFYQVYDGAEFLLKRLAIACDAYQKDGDIDDDAIDGKVISVEITEVTHGQDGQPLDKHRNQVSVII